MAQTRGPFDALYDNVKKSVPSPPKRKESVPGAMAMRNTLKGIRTSTLPKKGRRG